MYDHVGLKLPAERHHPVSVGDIEGPRYTAIERNGMLAIGADNPMTVSQAQRDISPEKSAHTGDQYLFHNRSSVLTWCRMTADGYPRHCRVWARYQSRISSPFQKTTPECFIRYWKICSKYLIRCGTPVI